MCEFHNSNGNDFGDILWTDKLFYFSSIDVHRPSIVIFVWQNLVFVKKLIVMQIRSRTIVTVHV